ncbi:MAG TPA: DUF1592 domain-containing protein [Gammaproteobacteria bacterium]|jgi:mono/diheme cytochrome c family protein
MRRTPVIAALLLVATLAGVAVLVLDGRDTDAAAARAMLDRYCVDCHNAIDLAGNLRLDDKNVAGVSHDAEAWESVVRKLRTGMMPPADEPRPARDDLDALAAELESRLDLADRDRPPTGSAAIRRLNRTEYGNAIRDLLELEVDASTLLPLDDSSEGFDNIASSLGVSPSLVESYVSAAMKISRQALGDRTATRTQVSVPVAADLRQDSHLESLPLGTRGGLRFEHQFPLDAEYEIRVGRGFGGRAGRVDLTIDGVPIEVGNDGSIRIAVTAGPHTLTAALIDTRRSSGVDNVYSEPAPTAGIQRIEIDGPFNATGISDTPSRQRILSCQPESAEEETECARSIVTSLADRAFRRPLTASDLPALMEFYEAGRPDGFEAGIQQALARILIDPRFLYRLETEPPNLEPGAAFRVDDFALASRLSFFLWSSIPDDQLLALAADGRLGDSEVFASEILRMLADERAEALVENFASQWLFLRELESVTPDAADFDENLRHAMTRESKLLFDTVMREDLSILRLLDADFTFVDEHLAAHYGIEGIRGSHFRRIELPDASPRRGLLGHGSILTLTSVTNRTSPVIRGSWILDTLLGSPPPTPPPNVETTLEGDDGARVALSVRERLEAHRENPVCASCHAIMDPIGFTLENFDLIGSWRDTEDGRPIDASAVLTDGTAIDGPAELRAALLDRGEAFVTTAVEKLMTYALGRRLEYYDMPTIRAIVRQAAQDDYRFSALVLGVAESEAFRTRVKEGAE